MFGQVFTDTQNRRQSTNFIFTPLVIATPVGDQLQFAYRTRYEHVTDEFVLGFSNVLPGHYTFHEGSVRVSTSRNRPLQADVTLGYGTFFDGRRTRLDLGLEWRPSYHWFFRLEYEFNDIRLPRGDSPLHVARLRAGVQFSPDISWVTFVQYDNLTGEAGVNTRLRWIIQDGREFFIVVNQGLDLTNGIEATRTDAVVKLLWTFTF